MPSRSSGQIGATVRVRQLEADVDRLGPSEDSGIGGIGGGEKRLDDQEAPPGARHGLDATTKRYPPASLAS